MMSKLNMLCLIMLACSSEIALAEENKFPELGDSYLKTGAFIGPDHVKRITPGLHKDQVRLELGNPHFNEGIFGVKTWNYAFNFYTGHGNSYVTCQYMVKFDSEKHVVSTHWKDNQCEDYVNPPQMIAAAKNTQPETEISLPEAEAPKVIVSEPEAPVSYEKPVNFEAVGLFPFAKYKIEDLDASGSKKLDSIVNKLKQDKVNLESIVVTGYTDYIGSEEKNLRLSQDRADTVRSYLELQNIDGRLITANGKGEASPIVQCKQNLPKQKLLECLQPNRRVEIEVKGVSHSKSAQGQE